MPLPPAPRTLWVRRRDLRWRGAIIGCGVVVVLGLGCGTEAPVPPRSTVLAPQRIPAPTSTVKFDVGAAPATPAQDAQIVEGLRQRLKVRGKDAPKLGARARVDAFYAARDHRPAWIADRRANAAAVAVVRATAKLEGLGVSTKGLVIPKLSPDAPGSQDPIELELQLTDLWLVVGDRILRSTKAPPRGDARTAALLQALETGLEQHDPGSALLELGRDAEGQDNAEVRGSAEGRDHAKH